MSYEYIIELATLSYIIENMLNKRQLGTTNSTCTHSLNHYCHAEIIITDSSSGISIHKFTTILQL